MLSVFAAYEYNATKEDLLNRFNDGRLNAAERIQSSLPEQLWNVSEAGYEKIIQAEMRDKNLYAFILFDDTGTPISIFNRKSDGSINKITQIPDISAYHLVDESKLVFKSDEALGQRESIVGKAHLYWDSSHIQSYLSDTINSTIFKILILDILIVFVIVLVIRGIISKPLIQLNDSFSEIANGKGNLVQKLPVLSSDELGILAGTFNSFLKGLHGIVSDVFYNSKDLSLQSQSSADFAGKIKEDLKKQTKSIEVLSSTFSMVNESANNIALCSKDSYEFSKHTLQETIEAKDNIGGSINKIFILSDNINNTSASMKVLNTDLERISEIVEMIKVVSARSNILAYNATIEAAQAGEMGKGFAIVASEMKDLSTKTSQFVSQVNEIIETVLADKDKAIDVLETTKAQADEGVSQAELASSNLDKTMDRLNQISSMSESISEFAERQKSLTNEVNTALQEIELVTQETTSNTQESAKIANRVESLSTILSTSVSNFTISRKDSIKDN